MLKRFDVLDKTQFKSRKSQTHVEILRLLCGLGIRICSVPIMVTSTRSISLSVELSTFCSLAVYFPLPFHPPFCESFWDDV